MGKKLKELYVFAEDNNIKIYSFLTCTVIRLVSCCDCTIVQYFALINTYRAFFCTLYDCTNLEVLNCVF